MIFSPKQTLIFDRKLAFPLPNPSNTPAVCTANSRVGAITNAVGIPILALGLFDLLDNKLSNKGRPNIKVLPLPVALLAMISYLFNSKGIACDWIGVGVDIFMVGDCNILRSRLSNSVEFDAAKSSSGVVPWSDGETSTVGALVDDSDDIWP